MPVLLVRAPPSPTRSPPPLSPAGRMWEQGVISVEVEAWSCDCLLNEWLQRGLGLGTGIGHGDAGCFPSLPLPRCRSRGL